MIKDLDTTIENILNRAGNWGTDVEISFEMPNREWSGKLNRPTLNFYCFDMRENVKLRAPMPETRIQNGTAQIILPNKRIDLTYLVTAWARKIEDEHLLIWRALSILKRFPVLKPQNCEGALRYQSRDIPLWVADTTQVQVNAIDLWSVLDNQLRLSFTLMATVELDLDMVDNVPLVLESVIRTGQSDDPTQESITAKSGEITIKSKTQQEDDIP